MKGYLCYLTSNTSMAGDTSKFDIISRPFTYAVKSYQKQFLKKTTTKKKEVILCAEACFTYQYRTTKTPS